MGYWLIAHERLLEVDQSHYPVVMFLDILPSSDEPPQVKRLLETYIDRIAAELPEIENALRNKPQKPTEKIFPPLPEHLVELLMPLPKRDKPDAFFESSLWRETYVALTEQSQRQAIFKLLHDMLNTADYGQETIGPLQSTANHYACIYYQTLFDHERSSTHVFLLGIIAQGWSQERKDSLCKDQRAA
ncbi:MAG: hypothetical protein KatS3mg114_0445 [Planctomycetaceae bacterium]|nr:MAG: hypothetical protein KatS3mg114_0445 [Planctomycetaceae bacterium]